MTDSPQPPSQVLRRAIGLLWTIWRRINKEMARRVYRGRPTGLPDNPAIVRLGSEYGGWHVPDGVVKPDWTCYAVGVGCDATLDLELIDRFGCVVHAFDPTPRAIRYVEGLGRDPGVYHFMPIGVWTKDTTLSFFAPADCDATSQSIYDLGGTGRKFDAPGKTLATVMRELGHERIDLLKLDVEGAWMPLVSWLARERIVPRDLCIEFDSPTSLLRVARARARLATIGLRIVHVEKENFLFLRDELIAAAPASNAPRMETKT